MYNPIIHTIFCLFLITNISFEMEYKYYLERLFYVNDKLTLRVVHILCIPYA